MTTSSYRECTKAPTTSRRGALLSTLDRSPVQGQGRIASERAGREARCSRDHHLARMLRVVFEESFLVFQRFCSGLHSASGVGHARDERVLAWRRAIPCIGQQLPGVLAVPVSYTHLRAHETPE